MAFALRLLLLLLLAVALPDRAAQAAPWRAQGADEGGRKAPPAAWLHEDFLPLEPHAGVSASRTFQAPFLVAARKPSSHHRGSPRGRNKPTEDKMLSELDRRYEMNPKAVLKVPFPGGSSGSWAASAAGREALPGTVPGDKGGRKAPPAAWLHEDFKPLEPHAGVSASRTFQAPFLVAARKPSSHHGGSPRGRNKPTEDKMLSELDRRYGGSMSFSLLLRLSSRGLSLHIWTCRAWHSGKGSMAALLPRCCFLGLQGCFPAWPGYSFSPAS
ncbi:uncharacterized protein LOC111942569, partial [Cyanistes caeruleus]|uniref:uncharacterized protein LOC111942569 n=1 Tax=Cyanistes caeruleus TaxID=156563 RepID=UPI000CDB2DA4